MLERISIDDSHLLKGLAISGVLAIHTIAQLTPQTFFAPQNLPWIIAIDQLSRLSVPLFIAISGYGFAVKYQHKILDAKDFIVSRMLKLLPLYVLWNAFLWIVLPRVPVWYASGGNIDYIGQLLYGGADYQMYFVPMILQLYGFFLLTWFLLKKHISLWMILAGIVQFGYILHYTFLIQANPSHWNILSETYQYLRASSWIGYFLLGIWLAVPSHFKKIRKLPLIIWIPVLVVAYLTAFISAKNSIANGTDALLALRFTRWEIMLFATSGILFGISQIDKVRSLLQITQSLFRWLGKYSYLIFLSHTVMLRIAVSAYRGNLTVAWTVGLTLLTFSACLLSLFIQRQLDK